MSHAKRRLQDPIRRFVDLEAQVDDEDEDEDEDLNDDDFIDDSPPSAQPGSSNPSHEYISWTDFESGSKSAYDDVIHRWQQRASLRESGGAGGSNDNDAIHRHQELAARHEPSDDESLLTTSVRNSPTENDYPIWRVRCRPGIEEEAVFYLSQKATLDHQLRSAFTRSSTFRGWIYIEAKINDELSKLLKSTPGLVHQYPDVSRNQIDFEDWTKLLTMTDRSTEPSVGSWVRIHSGLYKGDIGFLTGIEIWGGISVLLIPRLPPPYDENKFSGKRKRFARPAPTLFDPEIALQTYSIQPVARDDGYYHFLNSRFRHGLICKKYNLHSVSPASEITIDAFQLFLDSHHPELTMLPRPVEWVFEEGGEVLIISSLKRGVISQVQVLSAEVELHNGEGLVNVPWHDLEKVFRIGDFIEVVKGSESGTQGWVTKIEGDFIDIISDSPLLPVLDQVNKTTSTQSFHVNRVRCTTPPEIRSNVPESEDLPSRDRIPWLGMTVVNTQKAHQMKGHQAIIKDVLCGKTTKSGLEVVIQYTGFDPSNPMHKETIDYDNVLHAKDRKKLFDVKRPAGPNRQRFEPANHASSVSKYAKSTPPTQKTPPETLTTATGTPLPNHSPSWTPAWDPSSRTPLPHLERSHLPLQSPSRLQSPQPPTAEHVLLNPLLMGKKMKASANSGPYLGKELIVFLAETDGVRSIRTTRYNKSEHIAPEWITPKHPNATRDNGLLVVIRGEHCGKYVRRIYHRYGDSTELLMMLAVIEGIESGSQVLSQEQLSLDSSDLCLCDETKAQRKAGDKIMEKVRGEARKGHGI